MTTSLNYKERAMNLRSHTFWDKHAKDYKPAYADISEVARYRERTEFKHVFSVAKTRPIMDALDLGCGFGRWTVEFAKRCRRVVAVDFSVGMIERARRAAKHFGLDNIEFHVAPIQEFRSFEKFDIIFISHVLVNISDKELLKVFEIAKNHLRPEGRIILREIVVNNRQEVRDEFHERFGDTYSVIYRTPDEYIRAFERIGMKRLYAEDIAPINFPLGLYRRIVPKSLSQIFLLRKLLQMGLAVQYSINPLLLRHKWVYRPFMNRFGKRKNMLFVFGIN